jgi:nucleoside phosphorylase
MPEPGQTRGRAGRDTLRPTPIPVSQVKGHVHVAIITIRTDEYEAVESMLGDTVPIGGGNNSYELAEVAPASRQAITVVLTRCVRQGNLHAQAVANNIIQEIDPAWLFLVGIAGGVPSDEFGLGDVIIASALHSFSFGAVAEGGKRTYEAGGGDMHPDVESFLQTKIVGSNGTYLMELAGFGKREEFTEHPNVLRPDLGEAGSFYGDPSFREELKRKLSRRFPNWDRRGGPLIHSGPCVNADLLVKDTKLLKKWQQSARQVVEVETELAGVYEAARSAGRRSYPLLAIRGISDIVGLRRDPDWTPYACSTAAAIACAILRSGFIDFAANLPGV